MFQPAYSTSCPFINSFLTTFSLLLFSSHAYSSPSRPPNQPQFPCLPSRPPVFGTRPPNSSLLSFGPPTFPILSFYDRIPSLSSLNFRLLISLCLHLFVIGCRHDPRDHLTPVSSPCSPSRNPISIKRSTTPSTQSSCKP